MSNLVIAGILGHRLLSKTCLLYTSLPAAKSGIATAIVLGIGRAIGEAMAITLVSGSAVNIPLPFNSVRFLTTAIVAEMSYSSGLHRQVLFTIGPVSYTHLVPTPYIGRSCPVCRTSEFYKYLYR